MHWIWRSLIAVLAATLFMFGSLHMWPLSEASNFIHQVTVRVLLMLFSTNQSMVLGQLNTTYAISLGLPTAIVTLIVYGLLMRYFVPVKAVAKETRCRKCQYILRGITEPRCPECGEKI